MCRVRGVGSGTVLAPVLALSWHRFWHGSCTGPALAWPTGPPRICTRPRPCGARTRYRPCHLHPGYTPAAYLVPLWQCAHRGRVLGGPLGSLWAAPVDRPAELVTCPLKPGTMHPLNGTHQPAPCVTLLLAKRVTMAIYTLLWSTFINNAVRSIKTPARAYL